MRHVQASFMKRCTSLENGMRKRLALCDHHSHASNQRNRAFSLLFALQKDLLLQFKGTLEIECRSPDHRGNLLASDA